jgi:hypothetical protein
MTKMPDPTAPPCDCGWLDRAADDPSIPVAFDAEVNEYQLVTSGHSKGRMPIYHCPFCGGSAPKSKRESLFAHVTADEFCRLGELTKDVSTVSEALTKFGPPDEDIPNGYGEIAPSRNGQPGRSEFFRVMRYNGLSQTTVVDVVVRPENRVSFSYGPKYVGGHDG